MLPDLLVEIQLRRRQRAIADALLAVVGAGMRGPHHIGDRREVARALGQHRMADIDVVAIHMRRPVEAVIDDAVVQPDLVRADLRFDAADEMQVLAEHRRLLHHAFGPEHAVVAVPALAVAGEPRRDGADAAVDRMADGLAWAVDIVVGRLVVHEQDVVEPAGDEQAGEGAQPGEAALALIFVQARMAEAGRRMPADRHAAVLAVGDVERAVDQHREAQAGAGAELQHADAALDAVAERHQPHAGELRQRPGVRGDLAARQSSRP